MYKQIKPISLLLLISYAVTGSPEELNQLQDIKVIGTNKTSASSLQLNATQSSLTGKELERNKSTTLGKTLEKIAGVNNEAYGPNASRPSIRSLSGNRVSILTNNLPMNDIASMSGNMGIPLDISMSENIEVTKGSSAVIYGGHAIGGAVNVLDGKIPTKIKPKKFSGKLIGQVSTNNGEQQGFNLDANNGKNFAVNLRASKHHVSKYKIPGRTKHSACYDRGTMRSLTSSILRDHCQVFVDMSKTDRKDPTTFKYIDSWVRDRLDDPDWGLDENDMYPSEHVWVYDKSDWILNPAYIEGSEEGYISVIGEPEEYANYPDKEIPNSSLNTESFSFGASYINEWGYIGASISQYQTKYGVPGYAYRASRTEQHEQQEYLPVSVGSENTRLDIKSELYNPTEFLTNVAVFLAHSNSLDQEFVGPYESARFKSHNNQARIELSHQPLFDRMDGVIGVSLNHRNLRSSGPDAYLPSVKTSEQGIFILETLDLEPFEIGAGYSLSKVKHRLNIPDDYDAGAGQGATLNNRDFNLKNKHFYISYNPIMDLTFKFQKSLSQRAPEINELYAHGAHYANLIEEQGKSSAEMQKEKNNGLEFTVSYERANFLAEVTAYKNKFTNFSYLRTTGIFRNGLLVKEWDQTDLTTKGVEVNLKYKLATEQFGYWTFAIFGDLVKNKARNKLFNAGDYLPNLPSSKYGASIEFERNNWSTFISAIHFKQQKETGNTMFGGDVTFPKYTTVDAGISYSHKLKDGQLNVDFSVSNLTNVEARPNSSQLKYLAPLPGRSFNLALAYEF